MAINNLASILLCVSILLAGCSNDPLQPFDGKVVSVHDGDTLTVARGSDLLKIRLARIDAPELDQEFGTLSRERLQALCASGIVHIAPKDFDRNKRIIGELVANDKNVNEELVREGLAWWYRDFDQSDPIMESLQNDAQLRHAGLWKSKQPPAPWEFRKDKKNLSLQIRTIKKNVILSACCTFGLALFAILLWYFRRRRRAIKKGKCQLDCDILR